MWVFNFPLATRAAHSPKKGKYAANKTGAVARISYMKDFVKQKPSDFQTLNKNIPLAVALDIVSKSKYKRGEYNLDVNMVKYAEFLLDSLVGVMYDCREQITDLRMRSTYGKESGIKMYVKMLAYKLESKVEENN